jgi:hypothetical protein
VPADFVPALYLSRSGQSLQKIVSAAFALIALGVFIITNYVTEADKIFLQPQKRIFASAGDNKVNPDETLLSRGAKQ